VVKDDGSFVLETYGKEDGAPAGDYKVMVTQFEKTDPGEGEGASLPLNLLPAQYGRFETSGLTVRIVQGENQIPALKLMP
jgi:hypothetical protein